MTDISSILSSYAEIVNKMLEKYVPKKVDERTMTEIFGAAEYRYEPESINKGIFEPFWDLLERGGKRWRPALMLMIYEALGGKIEEIAPLSIIPEVIHNGTLAVDDVEDESEFRRGKPCIHRIYGTDIAINMGNFMYYFPLTVLDRVDVGEEKKLAILDEYVRLM
ncbi:MAG: polyprenyl synthetase family protein, partial [Thaumarchaeota archaeon]|nr:polyprenyl synthetase family protein [Nitrososphaerota archaeon]